MTNESLMQDVVEMAFENRMFYAHAAELAENPVLKKQYGRMTQAKDEFLDTVAILVAGRSVGPAPSRALGRTLQELYARALAGLGTFDAASDTFATPIGESEERLLEHFDRAIAMIDSVAVRAALAAQMPKLRACHRDMQRLAGARSGVRA